MTWARSSKRELVPPRPHGCPGEPQLPAWASWGAEEWHNTSCGGSGLRVPSWAGIAGCILGFTLISPSCSWVHGGCSQLSSKEGSELFHCCCLQLGSSLYPSLLPSRFAGIAAIPHDPGSLEHFVNQEDSATAKERQMSLWGQWSTAASPNFYCHAEEPVRMHSKK